MNNESQENEPQGPEENLSQPIVQLRLFVSGSTQRSQNAIQNLKKICEEQLKGQYELEVIDVYQNPEQVKKNQILAVPTLLKDLPNPVRKIVGELSEQEKVLEGLDISPEK